MRTLQRIEAAAVTAAVVSLCSAHPGRRWSPQRRARERSRKRCSEAASDEGGMHASMHLRSLLTARKIVAETIALRRCNNRWNGQMRMKMVDSNTQQHYLLFPLVSALIALLVRAWRAFEVFSLTFGLQPLPFFFFFFLSSQIHAHGTAHLCLSAFLSSPPPPRCPPLRLPTRCSAGREWRNSAAAPQQLQSAIADAEQASERAVSAS